MADQQIGGGENIQSYAGRSRSMNQEYILNVADEKK